MISVELQTELDTGDYNGYTYQEILELIKSKSVPTIGSIRGADLRDVVSILASGLQHRLNTATIPEEAEPLRTALLTGFKFMTIPDYAFNLASPEVSGMLQMATAVGLVTNDEYNKFVNLATYQKPAFPDVTLRDIIEYKEPALISDKWIEIPETDHRRFYIRLRQALPETINVVIQARDQYHDGFESEWYHCTTLRDIYLPREYVAELGYNGYARKLRWKALYVIPLEDTGTK